MREMGIIQRLIELIVSGSQRRHRFNHHDRKLKMKGNENGDNDSEEHTVKVFSLADLRSIFTITSAGVLIALLTFAFECLRSYCPICCCAKTAVET